MTEEEQAQLESVMGTKVAYSLRAAASEVLGNDYEAFSKYFQFHFGTVSDAPAIVVVEQATGQQYQIPILFEIIQLDSDKAYYYRLKELAQVTVPFIPEEVKKIPKDEWPEPKWEPPLEDKKED